VAVHQNLRCRVPNKKIRRLEKDKKCKTVYVNQIHYFRNFVRYIEKIDTFIIMIGFEVIVKLPISRDSFNPYFFFFENLFWTDV